MSSATWWQFAWTITFNVAIVTSALTLLIILTLPTSYSHFQPRYVTEDILLSSSKGTPEKAKSAYARLKTSNKETNGRINFRTSVQIVVLGDIGRSPRMQYHALSIASHGGLVEIIGYDAAEIHPDILTNPLINIIPIRPFPPRLQTNNKLVFLLLAPLKILWQICFLYHALAYRVLASKFMLVQNPPSIPTLMLCQLVCFLRNTRLVVDWHNFGYSILALRLGFKHPVVRFAAWYEGFFAQRAVAHFAVTDAMAKVLQQKWKINALPLHDRPADIYQPFSSQQRAAFLVRLPGTAKYAEEILSTRCRLIVSSTSWTADEDFSILLDALVQYSATVAERPELPNIIAIITGKGPQREHYLRRISALTQSNKLQHAIVATAWLSPEDYAGLLASADLGVSLHTSSSGVDLPMKVVDMFGTGLPVAGWSDFEAWPELVQDGVNGRDFDSAERLAKILEELFGGDGTQLQRLKDGAMKECERRWDAQWLPIAGQVFQLND